MNLFYTPEYAKTGDVIPFYNQKDEKIRKLLSEKLESGCTERQDRLWLASDHNGRQPDLQRNPDKHSGWNRVCDRSGRCLPYVLLYLRSEPAGPVGKTCDKQRS